MTTADGQYTTIDGRSALRFERTLSHPIGHVWRSVTAAEGLATWFPCRIEGDLMTVGSELTFVFPDTDETSTGRVLEVEPEARLWFTWADEEIRIDLTPDGEGSRIVFADLMPHEYLPGAARTAAGWTVCLDALESGTPASHDHDENFREIYQAYVSAGVPHDAPAPWEEQG